ncbi:MAG: hypothetical protein IT460_15600 [Planctomycetes bacterium]|nr:hypothetical protein [Planctomycetota bacterium]
MDEAPKALRLATLLTTAVVVIGGAAGFLVWMVAHERSRPRGAVAPADVADGEPRPVPHLPSTTAAVRGVIDADVATLIDPSAGRRRREVEDALVSAGVAAVPPMLSALAALAADPGTLATPAGQAKAFVLDKVLTLLRAQLTPADPAGPRQPAPEPVWLARRIRAWFGWWDGIRAQHGG